MKYLDLKNHADLTPLDLLKKSGHHTLFNTYYLSNKLEKKLPVNKKVEKARKI